MNGWMDETKLITCTGAAASDELLYTDCATTADGMFLHNSWSCNR